MQNTAPIKSNPNSPPQRRLLPGAAVAVRSWDEIAATLDSNGTLDRLPFMPEMRAYCGKSFRVSTRVERVCEETQRTMRRIRDTVFLDGLRCDGSHHGGCRKACMIFWKEAWLRRANEDQSVSARPLEDRERRLDSACRPGDGQYICQSTELIRATEFLPRFEPGAYVRDILARNHSLPRLIRLLMYAAYLRLRYLVTGKSFQVLEGSQKTTPTVTLDLQPNDRVRVKTAGEIAATLDRSGKNQGLAFTLEMLPFCGRVFEVLQRLDWMIHDPTRKLIPVKNTVILRNVTCDGCTHLRGGCPRANYHFWREAWLEKVSTGAGPEAPGDDRAR